MNRPVDFCIGDECRVGMLRRSRASVTPTLSAKISSPSFVDHAAAITIAIEAERHIGPRAQHLLAHGMQHLHILGVGIVSRKGVVEIAVESRSPRSPRPPAPAGTNAPAVPLPQAHTTLSLRLSFGRLVRSAMSRAQILDENVRAAAMHVEAGIEHDVLETSHLVGAEGERTGGAHLHAGPTVVVVRGRHHRHARHVELELREICHRREGKADVMHLASLPPSGRRRSAALTEAE